MAKNNVFISWSGNRSKVIADALFGWLPMVIQSVKPWMSSHSIEKGSRSGLEMAKALDGTKVGITCLTPENLEAPWIQYEAGCLSKTIDDSTRLCTYLLGGLKHQDIKPPLAQFQHTLPLRDETHDLVRTINKAVGGDEPLIDKTLDGVFEKFWPTLEEELKRFPASSETVSTRTIEDMVAEILEFTRSETNRRMNVYQPIAAENYPSILETMAYDGKPLRFFGGGDSDQLKIVTGTYAFEPPNVPSAPATQGPVPSKASSRKAKKR